MDLPAYKDRLVFSGGTSADGRSARPAERVASNPAVLRRLFAELERPKPRAATAALIQPSFIRRESVELFCIADENEPADCFAQVADLR